jgi:hypothetical protein
LVTNAAALLAFGLAASGCSTSRAGPTVAGRHSYEVAVAWATGTAVDGFYFPIACPGPEKLVLFGQTRFQMACDDRERIHSATVDVPPDQPGDGDAPAAAPRSAPRLDCALVVVPGFKGVAGVLTDLKRGVAAKRAGPLDCALIRYD